MNFIPASKNSGDEAEFAYWFLFVNDQILLQGREDDFQLPFSSKALLNLNVTTVQYLGTIDGKACYTAHLSSNERIPAGMFLFRVRDLYGKAREDYFQLVGRAFHIATWDRHTLYCGSCGTPTVNMMEQRAKNCPNCRQMIFPRISPAIIVAIIKDDQILLARNRNLPPEIYTVIAGFVEPGESLEDCLQREVKEEVGIEVRRIQYFSSQPWPFPDSLMIAFIAEYAGGEIKVDGQEIVAAGWFTAGNLPPIPGKATVARKLIDWFCNTHS